MDCFSSFCSSCGLPGFHGEFCQEPSFDCDEVQCNGNGDCTDTSPRCDCFSGTGDTCSSKFRVIGGASTVNEATFRSLIEIVQSCNSGSDVIIMVAQLVIGSSGP